MFKIFIFTALTLISSLSLANDVGLVDMSKFTTPAADKHNDIAYVQLFPQYEENPDPKKLISFEIFSLELEKDHKSEQKLAYIKSIIEDDKRTAKNFKMDVFALTNDSETFHHSKDFQDFKVSLGIEDKKVHIEEVPSFLDYSAKADDQKKQIRYPSSLKSMLSKVNAKAGIKTVSLIRAAAITGGVYMSLHYGDEAVDSTVALSRAIWPGLLSGALAYKSGAFGAFLTNGKWSKALLESDMYFFKKIRGVLGVNERNFRASLRQNTDYYKEKYPKLYNNNPELFEKSVKKISQKRVKDIVFNRIKYPEEYIKWWVTELGFVLAVFELPTSLTGGDVNSASKILGITTAGFAAQGPGDIALQKRKFQMVQKLQKDLISGKVSHKDQSVLLDQLDRTIKKTDPLALHKTLHPELELLEAWARRRGALLSVLQVVGIGAGLAGVPIGSSMLVGIGAWGIGYYAHVQGLLKPKNLKNNFKTFASKVKNMKMPTPLKSIRKRWCSTPFVPRRPNFIKQYAR
jgi:hypothetical protein